MANQQDATASTAEESSAMSRRASTSLMGDESIPFIRRLWGSRERISTRLVFYFIGAALITLFASAVAFVFFAFLDTKLQQVNSENVPQMISAFEVAQESAALAASLPRLSTATQSDFGAIVQSVYETQEAFESYISTISETETGSERAAELLEAGNAMRTNIEESIAVVNRRFELLAATDRVMDQVSRLQDQARGQLQQILDDQLFFAVTGYRDLSDPPSNQIGVNTSEFDTYRHLSEIESSLESAAELIAAAFNETDADQLVPLLERFEATRATVERYANLIPRDMDVSMVLGPLEQLFAIGEGPEGGFALRQEILRLKALEEQFIVANRAIVENLYASGEALVNAASIDTNTATGQAESATTVAVYLLLALNIAGIVGVALIVRQFVLRKFVRRVDTLADRMHTMADGDLEIDIPIDGKDEIATMAEALEVFRKKSLEALRLNEVERLNAELNESNAQLEEMNTQLKAAQQQIVMREKLAAMGELTAGVAHEIKNPLNFMMNFAEVSQELIEELFEELEVDEKERDEGIVEEIQQDLTGNLQRIRDHGDRANSIVRDMLAMGREASDWVPTDINRVLSEHARLAFHSTRAADSEFQLDIKEELAEDLPEIDAIPNDIARVFLNMFMNACYATNKRRLEHAEGDSYSPTLTIRTELEGDFVDIQIEDNGTGVEKEAIEKIFQPFFTTKPTDEGTGLGLALAADIVRAHGGNVSVDSEVMKFTRMTVRLPLKQSAEVVGETSS
ncbi:MAG: ATP-binding protein [Gammaproteobacteria bacterium]|nr:ATP-binding protein [Gammaproteobacteria bacterium]